MARARATRSNADVTEGQSAPRAVAPLLAPASSMCRAVIGRGHRTHVTVSTQLSPNSAHLPRRVNPIHRRRHRENVQDRLAV